jgi:hypothetical protein
MCTIHWVRQTNEQRLREHVFHQLVTLAQVATLQIAPVSPFRLLALASEWVAAKLPWCPCTVCCSFVNFVSFFPPLTASINIEET